MSIRDHIARKSDPKETHDFIPTPGWATRVLYEDVHPVLRDPEAVAWDPAAGRGHMAEVLMEYHHTVHATDAYPYDLRYNRNLGDPLDFTDRRAVARFPHVKSIDHVVTNPPYSELNAFISNGLHVSRKSLCLLVRIQALEGLNRYESFYKNCPPSKVAIFTVRIPFKSGKTVRKAPKMYMHVWLVWDKDMISRGECDPIQWIDPKAQQKHEKDRDYDV